MNNKRKKIIWIDEKTSDFTRNASWNFQSALEDEGYELIICGEKSRIPSADPAIECLESLKKYLDLLLSNGEQDTVAAFIVDIHIPVDSLGIFSDDLLDVKASTSGDTGFLIVQYIICNLRRNLSPYGSAYAGLPILFLSISKFTESEETQWMGEEYKQFSPETYEQFSHIEKKFEPELPQLIASWTLTIPERSKHISAKLGNIAN